MKRIQLEIALGTLFVIASATILLIMGLQEEDRLARYEGTQLAEKIEFGASIFETNCTSCHGSNAQGTPGVAPCLRCEDFFTTRISEVGWGGTLEDYVVSVVTVGRQVSTRPALYVGGGSPAMPTWSEKFGGPLREDQVAAVAAFIVNFEPYALGEVPIPTPFAVEVVSDDPIARGRLLFSSSGCVACHTVSNLSSGTVGPVLNGLATRGGDMVAGLTVEEYIYQSVMDPSAHVAEGFADNIMPKNFGEILSEDEINDLVNFLLSLED